MTDDTTILQHGRATVKSKPKYTYVLTLRGALHLPLPIRIMAAGTKAVK